MDKVFMCKICDLNFMNEAMLLTHATTVHSSRSLESVIHIPSTMGDEERPKEVEEELINQDDNGGEEPNDIYLCSACGDIFMNDEDMEEHCRVAHDAVSQQRIYECSQCHERYESEVAFDEHVCDDVKPAIALTPTSNVNLDDCTVIELGDNTNSLMCDSCSIIFVSRYALNRHQEIVHKNRLKSKEAHRNAARSMFQCSRCSADFPDMRALKSHSVEAHQMKWNNVRQRTPQCCFVCNKTFSSMGNLNKHLKVVHKTQVSGRIYLTECEQDDKAKETLEEAKRDNLDPSELASDTPEVPASEAAGTESASESTEDTAEDSENADNQVYSHALMDSTTVAAISTPKADNETGSDEIVPESVPPNASGTNDTALEMIVEEGGTISINEQAIVVEDSANMTSYVVQFDDNVFQALDVSCLHMVVEDHTFCGDGSQNCESNQETVWYCSTCASAFQNREMLLVHHRQLHLPDECEPETNSSQQCDICLKIFSTKGNRDKHVNTVHRRPTTKPASAKTVASQEIRISCEHCEKTFRFKYNLAKHMRYSHPEQCRKKKTVKLNKDATDEDKTCHICGKQFPDLMKKEMHVYNHSRTAKEYRCEICDQTFARRDYYKEHYDKKHGVPKFKCTYCEKRFVRRAYQQVHERIHTGARPYICKTCGKGFKQWGALHQHQRFHAPKPPATHFCTHCHRGYSYKGDLDRHMVVHSDRKHVCEFCSKAFPTASQLTVHIRTHTGQRPYKCRMCSMCFMTMGGLKRHEQIHERREQGGFMCAICGVSYRRQASVDEHIRVFHNDQVGDAIEIQSVDLTQETHNAVGQNEEVVQLVVGTEGTVQVGDGNIQVLTRYVNTWVDTADGEKELVEGILATQENENLIMTQSQDSEVA